jgi:intracellular septation protein A
MGTRKIAQYFALIHFQIENFMSDRSKSGVAFILLSIIAYMVSYVVLREITDQLHSVMNSLPEADHSVVILNRVVEQCGYIRTTVMALAAILFGIGVHYYRSGKTAAKG